MSSTGVTSLTAKKTVYGAGVWVRNYDAGLSLAAQSANVIGATRGGNEMTISREYTVGGSDLDGSRGRIKGMTRILKASAMMKATFADMDVDMLLDALPGATASSVGGRDTITCSAEVGLGDYLTNIALVLDHATSGLGTVAIVLSNPLAMEPVVFSPTNDDDSLGVTLAMESHYDPASMATEPWQIIVPTDTLIS